MLASAGGPLGIGKWVLLFARRRRVPVRDPARPQAARARGVAVEPTWLREITESRPLARARGRARPRSSRRPTRTGRAARRCASRWRRSCARSPRQSRCRSPSGCASELRSRTLTVDRADVEGRKKAAMLCVSLGQEEAAQVFRHLSEDLLEQLTVEMARTSNVDQDDRERGDRGGDGDVVRPRLHRRGRRRASRARRSSGRSARCRAAGDPTAALRRDRGDAVRLPAPLAADQIGRSCATRTRRRSRSCSRTCPRPTSPPT